MRVHIVSVFPEYFRGPFGCGPTRVASEKNLLSIEVVNPRDFTEDNHRTIDDYPFGGGAGMVLKPEPVHDAIDSIRGPASHVVLLTPRGQLFNQEKAREYRGKEHLVLICGRYKDIDDRVRRALADEEVSVGDFVLAGGEAAAVAIVESVARLFPESVEHPESVETDSFGNRLLDAPYFTRPRRYRGMDVPESLVSGDHAEVSRWRRRQSLLCTARRRPELLGDETLDLEERRFLQRQLNKETDHGQEESN